MTETKVVYKYPDDDGHRTRPWVDGVDDGEKRCKEAVCRVTEVMEDRPWVYSEVIEVPRNSPSDEAGIDLFVPVECELLEFLSINCLENGVPFQVKSSFNNSRGFVRKHRIYENGKFCFSDNLYYFVLNGMDSKYMVLTDVVGQIVRLAKRKGVSEEMTLKFLTGSMADDEAVEVYLLNKMILEEFAWYLQE